MKKTIARITLLALAFTLTLSLNANPKKKEVQKLEGNISISGAFALYPLAVKWAEEFRKLHPDVKIDISAGGAGKGITDVLNNMVDIAMVSRDLAPTELEKGALPYYVAKDAVVGVVNAKNPAIKEILKSGVKKEGFNSIYITGEVKSWDNLFPNGPKGPIHVYTRSDASGAAESWAKYHGKKQEDLLGTAIFGDPGLATAVKRDPLGFGFNNIGYVYDLKTKKQIDGVRVVPIDVNGNGTIDKEEDFYGSIDKLVEAIADGRYPSPPARELFFVTKGKVSNPISKEFLKWVLTDGQKYVLESGFVNLSKERIKEQIQKIQ